ncbi:MAG: alpha/beta fold hydrolase [Chromatiales bacterium]|nr:MAG: alpha/beta fold hydrolase [Chromatiales bacterium]
MDELTTVVRETGPQPDAAVIWLHGLGADAYDFEPVVPMLALGTGRPLRFVFPNAPVRPVTLNAGMQMRAWYDIGDLDPDGHPEDEAGIRQAAASVGNLLQVQIAAGIPAGRIVLGGFSQGGATALFTALRFPQRLAGAVGLSCYLPLARTLAEEISAANRSTPVFQGHGEADPVVPEWIGRSSHEQLVAAGCDAAWRTYPIPHAVIPEELADVRAFLDRCLPPITGAV